MHESHIIWKTLLKRTFLPGLLLAGLLCSASPLAAQLPMDDTPPRTGTTGTGTPGSQRDLLDGVAAVVGNEVVLISDVLQQVMLYARQNKALNPQDPTLQREVLNAIIDEKLVLTRAREDSVVVSDDEITRAVDYQVQRIMSQFGGSEAQVEKAYGMSMDKIRRESREIIRQQFLVERMRQRKFGDVKPTENDMQEFYRVFKDSLPMVPEQVELQSIALLIRPSAEGKAATMALARSIADSIRAGGDFADFARRYSIDPSASNGGDLGFVEKGKFVVEFENTTKRLGLNEVSDPVETQFGIHVIQVLDRKDESTRSRHILLPIQQTAKVRDSIIARLNELRARARAGEDFSELARQYSEDDESKGLGGSLGKIPVEQLPPDSKSLITGMKEGDVSEPRPVALSATENGYQIVKLTRRIAPHVVDPQADRDQLERLAALYKQTNEYRKWIEELRQEIYWEIKTNTL